MRYFHRAVLLYFLFFGLGPATSHAQSVSGRVVEEGGSALAGATVALRAPGSGLLRFGATTSSEGAFELTPVAPGTYVLEIRFVGFRAWTSQLAIGSDDSVVDVGTVRLRARSLPSDEIVVTGARADAARAPITVTNISATELAALPDMKDLPAHLARQPSITFHSENGNAIGYSTLRLRGFGQRRLAVSINGIPQNDPEESNVFWINFFDIQGATQDIQIQRGATSARFGPAGIGGAISIRAMPYEPDFRTTVQVGAGAFGTRRYSAEVNSGLLGSRYVLFGRLSRLESDGYRDWSWTEFWRFFAGVTRYGDHHTLTLQAYGGPQRDGLAYGGIPREANTRTIDDGFGGTIDRKYNFSAFDRDTESFHQPHLELHHEWSPGGPWSVSQVLFGVRGVGYFDFGGTFRSADYLRLPQGFVPDADRGLPLFVSRPETTVLFRAYLDQWQAGWLPRLTRSTETRTTTIGAEARLHRSLRWGRIQEATGVPAELVGSDNDVRVYSFRGEKAIGSIFISHRERLHPLWAAQVDVQATVRQYRVYDEAFFGTAFTKAYAFVNPSVGITYRPDEPVRAFASIALAHREPRMKSLYDGEEAGAGSQPAFRSWPSTDDAIVSPERVLDVELGGTWSTDTYRFTATAFWMGFRDEIVPSGGLDQFGVPRTGNAAKTRHAGLELDGGVRVAAGFDIEGNASIFSNRLVRFTEFRLDGTEANRDGNAIAGFPGATANIQASWTRGGWQTRVMASHVGRQYVDNSDGDEEPALPAYTIVDVSASWSFSQQSALSGLRVSADVNNVLDRKVLAYGTVGAFGPQYFPMATRHVFIGLRYTVR